MGLLYIDAEAQSGLNGNFQTHRDRILSHSPLDLVLHRSLYLWMVFATKAKAKPLLRIVLRLAQLKVGVGACPIRALFRFQWKLA